MPLACLGNALCSLHPHTQKPSRTPRGSKEEMSNLSPRLIKTVPPGAHSDVFASAMWILHRHHTLHTAYLVHHIALFVHHAQTQERVIFAVGAARLRIDGQQARRHVRVQGLLAPKPWCCGGGMVGKTMCVDGQGPSVAGSSTMAVDGAK